MRLGSRPIPAFEDDVGAPALDLNFHLREIRIGLKAFKMIGLCLNRLGHHGRGNDSVPKSMLLEGERVLAES